MKTYSAVFIYAMQLLYLFFVTNQSWEFLTRCKFMTSIVVPSPYIFPFCLSKKLLMTEELVNFSLQTLSQYSQSNIWCCFY